MSNSRTWHGSNHLPLQHLPLSPLQQTSPVNVGFPKDERVLAGFFFSKAEVEFHEMYYFYLFYFFFLLELSNLIVRFQPTFSSGMLKCPTANKLSLSLTGSECLHHFKVLLDI